MIAQQEEFTFTVPLVPPGVNHYVKHTRNGRHYVTKDAVAFKEAVVILAGGRSVRGQSFEVEAVIYMGSGAKGDADGFGKLILDGLADARVFQKDRPTKDGKTVYLSDAHVTDVILRKRRDRENPRTEITVRGK